MRSGRDPRRHPDLQLLAGAVAACGRRRHGGASIAVAVIAAGGLAAVPRGPPAPQFQERDLLDRRSAAAPGTSQTAMERIAERAHRRTAGAIPGVESVGSHVGRAVMSDQVVNVNAGAALGSRIRRCRVRRGRSRAIRRVVEGYPGLALSVDTYLNDRAARRRRPAPAEPVAVRVFGPDFGDLRAQGEAVRTAIETSPASSIPGSRRRRSSPRSRSRSTSTRRSPTGSGRATSAEPPRRSSAASRSATCSRSRRSSR